MWYKDIEIGKWGSMQSIDCVVSGRLSCIWSVWSRWRRQSFPGSCSWSYRSLLSLCSSAATTWRPPGTSSDLRQPVSPPQQAFGLCLYANVQFPFHFHSTTTASTWFASKASTQLAKTFAVYFGTWRFCDWLKEYEVGAMAVPKWNPWRPSATWLTIQVSHDMILQEGVLLPALCGVNFLLLVIVPAARSPVFSHMSSSLQGLWTIRAFRDEQRFQDIFDAHQDLHSGAPFSLMPCNHCTICTVQITCIWQIGTQTKSLCCHWAHPHFPFFITSVIDYDQIIKWILTVFPITLHQPMAVIQTLLLHSASWYLSLYTTRWFAMRLDLLCVVFVTVVTFACILIRDGKKTLLVLPPVNQAQYHFWMARVRVQYPFRTSRVPSTISLLNRKCSRFKTILLGLRHLNNQKLSKPIKWMAWALSMHVWLVVMGYDGPYILTKPLTF